VLGGYVIKAVIVGFFIKRFFAWLRGEKGKA
jgi:hypothetical protein